MESAGTDLAIAPKDRDGVGGGVVIVNKLGTYEIAVFKPSYLIDRFAYAPLSVLIDIAGLITPQMLAALQAEHATLPYWQRSPISTQW